MRRIGQRELGGYTTAARDAVMGATATRVYPFWPNPASRIMTSLRRLIGSMKLPIIRRRASVTPKA
jgi:hypothetical protein